MPMSPNSCNKLTPSQKAVIQDRRNSGQSSTEIAHGTGIQLSTITGFLSHVKKHGFDENLSRSGWPRKTTNREDRRAIRKALGQTRIPLAQLPFLSDSNLSVSTIRRRLQEVHIRKWRAAKRPYLNKGHIAKRLR